VKSELAEAPGLRVWREARRKGARVLMAADILAGCVETKHKRHKKTS